VDLYRFTMTMAIDAVPASKEPPAWCSLPDVRLQGKPAG
jgi:hypothetical protein